MTFRNMKIPVEDNLDEIVGELEKRGYKKAYTTERKVKSVYTDSFGYYSIMGVIGNKNIITLADLKLMK